MLNRSERLFMFRITLFKSFYLKGASALLEKEEKKEKQYKVT